MPENHRGAIRSSIGALVHAEHTPGQGVRSEKSHYKGRVKCFEIPIIWGSLYNSYRRGLLFSLRKYAILAI